MSINVQQYTIEALFDQKQTFVVPKYQRGYAWDGDAIDAFITDLSECIDARERGTRQDHFFGGIVTVNRRCNVNGTTRENYEVIDGQQRLASFIVLISCISEYIKSLIDEIETKPSPDVNEKKTLESLHETNKEKILRHYINYRDFKNNEYVDVPKLTLSKTDHDFFERLISNKTKLSILKKEADARASHKRMVRAKEALWKFVKEKFGGKGSNISDKSSNLHNFLDGVLGKDCTVIFMCSDAHAEAYQIFQVLNDRGIHLGEGDLLRARTLELLDHEFSIEQDQVADNWDSILAPDTGEIIKYLTWYFSSREGRKPRSGRLTEEFIVNRFHCKDKNAGSMDPNGAKIIVEEVERLKRDVDMLILIRSGNWPWPTISRRRGVDEWDRRRLKMLVAYLKHESAMPLLLSLHDVVEDHDMVEENLFAETIASIERFMFRYKTISNIHAGPMISVYCEHAKKIREKGDDNRRKVENLRKDLKKLIEEHVPEKVFAENLRKIKYTPSKRNSPSIRYLLITINDYMRWFEEGGLGVPHCMDKSRVFDFDNLDIEHIYPQNAEKSLRDTDLESVKHTLGNLTVLDRRENSASGNILPSKKRDAFSKSSIKINQDIAFNCNEWTKQKIECRTEELIKMAIKIFVP